MKHISFGDTQSGITKREREHYALAREAAKEGIVLLENRGVLPLSSSKIALFGMGAVKTVAGGTGSGSVNARYTVNIRDGLTNAGITVTTQKYLSDCEKEFAECYNSWHDAVEEKVACLKNPYMVFATIGQFEFTYPFGREITDKDLAESDTDTAMYVLMRQAGEGNDRKLAKGDFYLDDTERRDLRKITAYYKHTVLVINVGGMVDLSFLDEMKGIDAVIYFAQAGMEGGNALGELVAGKANFSGKLADTWPQKYEDIPFGNEFNGSKEREIYKEGIFVGYRYFDTFGIAPRYPFGFGLSYTDFSLACNSVTLSGTQVGVSIHVNNVGRYAGKEIVQAYVSHLSGGADEAYQQLAGFCKTKELAASETGEAEISFDLRDCAIFCEQSAAWVLKAGQYVLRIGNSSRNTSAVAVFTVACDVTVEKVKSCCAAQKPICEISAPPRKESAPSGVPVFTVDCYKIAAKTHDYIDSFTETEKEKAVLDTLSCEEMGELVRGADLMIIPKGSRALRGNGGKTTAVLLDKGIADICFVDGPAGLNVHRHLFTDTVGTEYNVELPERFRWKVLTENIPPIPTEGTHIYRNATAWPVELLLAQTWNTDLLYRIGCAVGTEMEAFDEDGWLAPGMNIHRNPLCGRNFEYYSEDPFVTGKMAAALVRGVSSVGKIATIKHFCCNNRENERMTVSSDVDEKALRQIYLKGFEIAVKESAPKAVMSSYNRLNGVYTANRKDLLTDILRSEWGFSGVVMTDWGACENERANPALCMQSGNDLIMPGSKHDNETIVQAVKEGALDISDLRRAAARILRMIFAVVENVGH